MMPGFQGLLEVVRKDIRFPIRIRRASRRGRGGVFDLPMEVGRFHALHATFLGNFIDIVFQQAKAVADNCSDAAAPPSQYPSAPSAFSAGVPPHPEPETFRCDPMAFSDGFLLEDDRKGQW
jgi:hypothetical protein